MSDQRPPLDPAAFRAVCAYAVAHVILPDDVIRLAAGLRPREPFLISAAELNWSFYLGAHYRSILSALYRGNSTLFETAAPQVRGTVRTYFARTAEEIESTGNSNNAAPIPETPWYASINNSNQRRSEIVAKVMSHMGFSDDYSEMGSGLCLHHEARLPSSFSRALTKLPSA